MSGSNEPQTPFRVTLGPPTTPFWSQNTPGTGISAYPTSLATPTGSRTSKTPVPTSRKRSNKENELPTVVKRQKTSHKLPDQKPPLSVFEKLQVFHGFLRDELLWSYGELLFYTSQRLSGKNRDDIPSTPTQRHSNSKWSASHEQMTAVMQHFFNGRGKFTPAMVLENWFSHHYGRLERESTLMYSTQQNTPWRDIKPVRAALTSFAVQVVEDRLVEEAELAVHPSSGLHVSISYKKSNVKQIEWTDIGNTTVERTQDIIKSCQPLTWALLLKLAARDPRKESGAAVVRQKRPPELVSNITVVFNI